MEVAFFIGLMFGLPVGAIIMASVFKERILVLKEHIALLQNKH